MSLHSNHLIKRVALIAALLGCAVSLSGKEDDAQRRVSEYEVAPPYLEDHDAFWKRPDLFLMKPDREPKDRWPDEIRHPSKYGKRIIVLLPGDYTGRSAGGLPPGVLYIEDSGTAAQPILVVYAPSEGGRIADAPHPAERFGKSEARLTAFRIWNQRHQYVHGLTFSNVSGACLMRETTGSVIDRCLWHETSHQPLRIRFDAQRNLVQRCVFRRFKKEGWSHGDTVAIQVSDAACTDNRIISNVILNYTDAYQHTDREGDAYGLGAGTIIDNNFMGFTSEARIRENGNELLCGENALDFKMGGTEKNPIKVTNNVFFGVRAAKKGCAASGSGGYAVTFHRRGTWVELSHNLFIDVDAGVFLNAFFKDVDPAKGRIDPHLTLRHNTFSGVKSFADAFPNRTGRVLTGLSPVNFTHNRLIACERLMEAEPLTGRLSISQCSIYGDTDLSPRDKDRLILDGSRFFSLDEVKSVTRTIPWSTRRLEYRELR